MLQHLMRIGHVETIVHERKVVNAGRGQFNILDALFLDQRPRGTQHITRHVDPHHGARQQMAAQARGDTTRPAADVEQSHVRIKLRQQEGR